MKSAIAIDLGTRKCGFAVADALRLSITALEAARVPGDSELLLDAVAGLLEERDVDVLVVGLPLNMDGTESDQTRWTRKVVDRLRVRFENLDVVAYDERLTSKEAESRLREEGLRFEHMLRVRDSAAAAVILEDWISAGEPR